MAILIRLIEREVSPYMFVLIPIAAFLAAFGVGAIMMMWAGVDPLAGYSAFIRGSLGSPLAVIDTLLRMSPFLLMATGIAFSNRVGVLNIGAEGQYIMGAIVATWIALALQDFSGPLAVVSALILALMVGSLWALFAATLKAYLGINEIVTTVIMNWLAFRILQWLLRGPLKSPKAQMWPMSPPLSASLPYLIPGTRLHAGFLLAILIALIAYFILFKTNFGFKFRITGANPDVAKYAGYNVGRFMLISMGISGGLAGLAGACEILGIFHFLYEGIAIGLGYTSIIVALVGKNHPLAIIPSAFMFGLIYNGVVYLQSATGLTYTFSKALEGLIYLFVLLAEVLILYRIKIVRIE